MNVYSSIALLTPALLYGMIQKGNRYFVRQQVQGIFYKEISEVLIITHYADKGKALEHMQAVQGTRHCKLYDINDEQDVARLKLAASQPQGYKIFTTLLNTKKWKPPLQLEEKIRKYLRWMEYHPLRTDEVKAAPFFEFGVLFLKIRWSGNEIRIPFTDLNK